MSTPTDAAAKARASRRLAAGSIAVVVSTGLLVGAGMTERISAAEPSVAAAPASQVSAALPARLKSGPAASTTRTQTVAKAPPAQSAQKGSALTSSAQAASAQAKATAQKPAAAAAAPARQQSGQQTSAGRQTAAIQARIDRLTREVVPLVKPYDIGVSLIDNRSGRTWSYRGARAYSQASLVKLGTSVGVFLTADRNNRAVTSQERSWMRRALQVSDNPSQTALWSRNGGNSGYARAMKDMELSAATKPVAGRGWGYSLSTPNDQVKLMTALLRKDSPLKTTDAEWLLTTMRGVSAAQTWGTAPFGSAPGRVIEVKNGWSPYRPDFRWRLTSLGHIKDSRHDYTIAIMSNGWDTSSAGIPKLDAVGHKVHGILGY